MTSNQHAQRQHLETRDSQLTIFLGSALDGGTAEKNIISRAIWKQLENIMSFLRI